MGNSHLETYLVKWILLLTLPILLKLQYQYKLPDMHSGRKEPAEVSISISILKEGNGTHK